MRIVRPPARLPATALVFDVWAFLRIGFQLACCTAARLVKTVVRPNQLFFSQAQRRGGLLAVEDMVDALDGEFAKVTQIEQNSEIRAALEALTPW